MIKMVTDAWENSKGMLPQIHQAVIEATWKFGKSNDKFLSPETWLIQIARMTGADWPGEPKIFEYDFKSKLNFKQKKIKRQAYLADIVPTIFEHFQLEVDSSWGFDGDPLIAY